ncbi:MAG: Asp23/Gls24 family envelope stress response protein [Candidatus Omnitrophica bacterium]|nr:Asp23/Gls24 family envelope stress response protein [Candidatus Omnitrophota bacterium]
MIDKREEMTDLGAIKIHKDVIASIASMATAEIEGVKKIGLSIKSSFLELLGKQKIGGIVVEINRNNEIKINIPIIVKYGYNITEVASSVQVNVQKAVEKMTNVIMTEINVNVQGIEKE